MRATPAARTRRARSWRIASPVRPPPTRRLPVRAIQQNSEPGEAPADETGAVEEEVNNALQVGSAFEGRGADIVSRTGADIGLRKAAHGR